MLRAMRRMRAKLLATGDTGRYFRYAFGEIVLVIIGILIALQLNTANQQRVEQRKLHQYVQALITDLDADDAMLNPIALEMADVRRRIEQLRDYVANRPIEEMRNIDLYFLMRAPYYRPYTWNRAALEQMKSSGALRQMKNRELAERISAYEAFQHHLEEDFLHDREIAVRAHALANRVVNMNYPSIEALATPEELRLGMVIINFGHSIEDSLIHEVFGDVERSLLVEDEALLGEAVNAYQQIVDVFGLWPRYRVEMPQLRKDIAGLIADLQAEYPE